MKRSPLFRLAAAGLSLLLLTAPSAGALTTEQCAQLLQSSYIDQVPQSVLEQPTIPEMLDALGDPYTQYFTPEEYAAFTASMSDSSLVGIGVVMTQTQEGGVLLNQILEGSPAEKGGLMAGDFLVRVDGVDVTQSDTAAIAQLLQGEEDTTVKVTYRRDGALHTVTLTRSIIVIPATTSELIDDHIGYINCSTFGSETVKHFQEAIEKLGDDADVWIVDLRSNLGGLTDAATQSASLFTGPGDMAYLRNGANEYGVYRNTDPAMTSAPVIVLVDSNSASSSELFASAIRDNGAGIVVGTRSFGKGVSQTVFDENSMPSYFPDGDALKVTSFRFFSPLGNTADQVGVIPDLLVPEETVGDVAYLLSASAPVDHSANMLRLHMNWRWHIDLDPAEESEEYRNALAVLLAAIPTDMEYVQLWRCSESTTGWYQTTPQEVAEEFNLPYIAPGFPDHDASAYGTALSVLRTYGLIHGYDDGLFHPHNTLTRAELCQLLAAALNLEVPNRPSAYSDVAETAWYKPAVTAMSNFGLVLGDGAGQFHPEDPIDHQQFITILGRLGKRLNMYLYDTSLEELPEDLESDATLSSYATWAQPEVWLMSQGWHGYLIASINLLWESPEEIIPTAPTTRDEAVSALYNLLYRTGVLPRNRNVITD